MDREKLKSIVSNLKLLLESLESEINSYPSVYTQNTEDVHENINSDWKELYYDPNGNDFDEVYSEDYGNEYKITDDNK